MAALKSIMTGCRCNYDGLKLIRFGALNGRARDSTLRRSRSLVRSTVSVVINGDNYNESTDYSDYLVVARAFSLSGIIGISVFAPPSRVAFRQFEYIKLLSPQAEDRATCFRVIRYARIRATVNRST